MLLQYIANSKWVKSRARASLAIVRNECTFTAESVHLLLVFDLLALRAGELITRDIVLVERGFYLDIDFLMIIPFVALVLQVNSAPLAIPFGVLVLVALRDRNELLKNRQPSAVRECQRRYRSDAITRGDNDTRTHSQGQRNVIEKSAGPAWKNEVKRNKAAAQE